MHSAVTPQRPKISRPEFCELFPSSDACGCFFAAWSGRGFLRGCRFAAAKWSLIRVLRTLWMSSTFGRTLMLFLLDVQPADEEELEACRIFHLRCELAGSREISMRATEVVSRRNSILTSSSRPLPRNPSSPASCGGLLQLRLRPCPWSRVVPRLLNVLWMS